MATLSSETKRPRPWQEFEELVARIQKATAPQAIVRRNHWVAGRSGRRRQLDISLSQRIGLHDVLIVVECKRHKRRVTIEKIEAFAAKLEDVGAAVGVMVSVTGFDEGARAVAARKGIALHTVREAQTLDWDAVTRGESWLKFLFRSERDLKMHLELDAEAGCCVSDGWALCVADQGEPVSTLADLQWEMPYPVDPLQRVGPFRVACTPTEPVFVTDGKMRLPVKEIVIEGVGVVTEYVVNLRISGGQVVEDAVTGEVRYRELVSEPWDWSEVLQRQNGRELTADEWQASRPGERSIPVPPCPVDKYRYWKVVVKQGPEQLGRK